MEYNLVVADSPKEIQIHDNKRYRVELVTFYITPLTNIGDFDVRGGGLKDKSKLISTRVTFSYIKYQEGYEGEFPNFCCN